MVQLPDGTMERRLKLPLNVDPGVHSSFNLDQLVLPGSPLNTGNTLSIPSAGTGQPPSQLAVASSVPQSGGLPTITEVKTAEQSASGHGSSGSEESSRCGSGEIKQTETDSGTKKKEIDPNANEPNPSILSSSANAPISNPIPIPESIKEEDGFGSRGTSYDSSEALQLSSSAA